jgi:hypothetical protein
MCALSIRSEPQIKSPLFDPVLPTPPKPVVAMVLNKISDHELLNKIDALFKVGCAALDLLKRK